MNEVTRVITVEFTKIERIEGTPAPMPDDWKRGLEEILEDLTGCDHVHVVKVQDFILEGAENDTARDD